MRFASPLTIAILFLAALSDQAQQPVPGTPTVTTTAGPVSPLPVPPSQTIPLTAASDVPSSIAIDAALLPFSVAKRIFGKEVAANYAVVQITIANHNDKASFIVQSAKLDASHWLLNGTFSGFGTPEKVKTGAFGQQDEPGVVSSTEARLVRGELQDAQPFSARNWVVRGAIAAGSIASGFQFLTMSTEILAGISAYGNQVVPALSALWPDSTQAKIDRISDFGFQTNHVIAKSDIIIGFFPIDHFLLPDLKKIYQKAPAAFFNPSQMLLDKKYRPKLIQMLTSAGAFPANSSDEQASTLVTAAITEYETKVKASGKKLSDVSEQSLVILSLLNRLSLNNIRVVVDGTMNVDTSLVPAILTAVNLSENPTLASTWKVGIHKATITGSFLEGGVPSVLNADSLGITAVTVDRDNSSDTKMALSYTLTKDLPLGTVLSFLVVKAGKDKSQTVSVPVTLNYSPLPNISGVTTKEDATTPSAWAVGTHTGTITGSFLSGTIPSVKNAALGFSNIMPDTANSTDTALVFQFTLTKAVPTGTTVTFFVTRPASQGKDQVVSNSVDLAIKY